MGFAYPDYPANAISLGGVLTAQFPGVPTRRKISAISCSCTTAGNVNIYIGTIADPARITSVTGNQKCNYAPVNPRYIPAGATVYVQWTDATPGTDTASAILTSEQDD